MAQTQFGLLGNGGAQGLLMQAGSLLPDGDRGRSHLPDPRLIQAELDAFAARVEEQRRRSRARGDAEFQGGSSEELPGALGEGNTVLPDGSVIAPDGSVVRPPQGRESAGLLGKITGGIKGLLSNPTVQGVAGAAAFGANPLLGLLAGPGIKASRERRMLENEAARQALRQSQQQRTQTEELRGFIDSLAAQPGGEAGAPGTPGLDPRQVQLLRLMAGQNPAAAIQATGGLLGLGQPDRQTSLIKNLQAAGIDPRSEEGRELVTASISGGDISAQLAKIQAIQAELDIERRQEELANIRAERNAAEQDDKQQRIDLRNAIATDVDRGLEAAQLLSQLEGSFLQPGEAADVRQFGVGLAGLISPEQRQLAARSERFNQIATQFGLRTLEMLKGTGTISNQKFQTLLENSLSGARSPEANRAALADLFEETISAADKLGIEVPKRGELEALIPQLREGIQGQTCDSRSGEIKFLGFE